METFSPLLSLCVGNSLVTGEFPAQRPVMQSFDVFFDLCLNKLLSKQSWGWWFEMPSGSLWHHCNEVNYPRPVLAFWYCRCLRVCLCVCLSVNHQLVRAVTHQPFELESPNLDQIYKRPWLRSLLFFGMVDLEFQGQIELKSQNLPHFELVRVISHHKLKSLFPNFGLKCILALLRFLLILGWIDLDVLFYFSSQTCLFYQNVRLIIHLRRFVYI